MYQYYLIRHELPFFFLFYARRRARRDHAGDYANGYEEIDGPCLRTTVMREETSGLTTHLRSICVHREPRAVVSSDHVARGATTHVSCFA